MSSQRPAQKRVRYQVSPSYASTSFITSHPVTPTRIPIAYRSEGSLTVENPVHRWIARRVTPINVFPDDVLLEIFDIYVGENPEAWQSLVHVCRRWRCLILASPHRLDLRIVCTLPTPVRDKLDVWPALPLLVQGRIDETLSLDNIIAALGHRNRVSEINLWDLASSQLTKVWEAMKEPFPKLMDLRLRAFDRIAPLDPDLFMGGSAPRLRYLQLERIPYPGLPNLLLSATHLVSLRLYQVPHTGYISPEAMVTCLSMLTRLETLSLEFRSLQSHLGREGQRLPLPTRSVLPALMNFHFRGVSEYLEDLTSRVDAPRLKYMHIRFTHEVEFDNPQLVQFISRTPALKAPDEAQVIFDDSDCWVTVLSKASGIGEFNLEISGGALEWQLPALTRVCNLSLPPLFAVEDLYICKDTDSRLNWDFPTESEEWLELLKPFPSVKNLYLCDELRQRIALTLRLLVGDRVTEVLPILESIFLEGPRPSSRGIGQSISPAHPPDFYSNCPRPLDSFRLDHEEDLTAPPPAPQLDLQSFSLDVPQPSGSFQEEIWPFISPQQPDPQNLHLDYIQPSGPSVEDSQQNSSVQLPTMYNPYSTEPQTSRPFQEGGWSDPQNLHLEPSEPFYENSEQHFSAQSPNLQTLHSVESHLSRPFQDGDRPDLQNLQVHVDWSLPSEPFNDSERYSSLRSPSLQSLYSVEEGVWPDSQNLHLDWSLPSEPFHDSERYSSVRSPSLQSLYSVEEGVWPDSQNLHLDWSLPSEPFHEDSQYSSAQSLTVQNLDSGDLQPPRVLQGGRLPDPQNFHLDGSQPSGLFQWEECIGEFAAARQETAHPIEFSSWRRKY